MVFLSTSFDLSDEDRYQYREWRDAIGSRMIFASTKVNLDEVKQRKQNLKKYNTISFYKI